MDLKEKKILVTGSCGFIGFHLSKRLIAEGAYTVGLDNINDYYDVSLKEARLKQLEVCKNYKFYKLSLEDTGSTQKLFREEKFDIVVNLAAQAGVRYSLTNPKAYIDSNINGFMNILEGCRHNKIKHLVYASSSSVYGANTDMPFSVSQNVDHPLSLYAATKKSNELMAHTYASLYNVPCTGLRFFTVYGPWGRPDMALFIFAKAILNKQPIDIYNNGNMLRDFTYVDDIIEGVCRVIKRIPLPDEGWNGKKPDPSTSFAPYRLYNIGNNSPVELMKMISVLEESLGSEAKKNFMPLQPGDVPKTYADVSSLEKDTGFKPETTIDVGVKKFVDWYKSYYKVS